MKGQTPSCASFQLVPLCNLTSLHILVLRGSHRSVCARAPSLDPKKHSLF